MSSNPKFNIVVIGVSCFDGMASSIRVRNLLETPIFQNSVALHNLIYKVDAHGLDKKKGVINNINFQIISASNILSFFSFNWQAMRFLKRNKSETGKNILYNYQYLDIKNLFLLLYARSLGYKIILDIVENNKYYTTFSSLKSRMKIATSIKLLKLTPKVAHHIITISTHLKTMMTKVCDDKIPITLIPITVDFKRFKNSNISLTSPLKIFYGGSFGIKDGMEYLLSAFGKLNKKYNNIELIMTGRASVEDFQVFEKHLEESTAQDKIFHLGFLNDDDYYRTLNSCHIFCMTRTNSKFANAGFPFKLGEFLATGKGVIATKVGDVPNYLENAVNALLIEPESVEELEQSISYFLDNPEEIKTIGKRGKQVAEKHFDSLYWSKQLRQIFNSI